jgi:hypothetical protein
MGSNIEMDQKCHVRITENRRLETAAAAMRARMITRSTLRVFSPPALAMTLRGSAAVIVALGLGSVVVPLSLPRILFGVDVLNFGVGT